jgi:glycosyltransferase involved in cell wall biosynthesis
MLSIIIPTLNEEKYLPLLLKEIKKQSFKDYEIIIADADSKDKTVKIAENYGCKIVPGGLPPAGRNAGAKAAERGTFLFMDADNIFLPPDFLKNLIEEFERRNLDVASFSIYPRGNKFDKLAYGLYNWWTKITQNFLPHATNAILVKKEIHQTIGGFDEEIKMAEDHAYVRKAAKYGKFGFIKTEPVFTSSRRLERDGRLKTYLKYLSAGFYMLFFGNIKSDIFKYRFNYNLKNNKNKI